MISRIQKIIKEYEYKNGQMGNWRSYIQDVNSFVLPRKAWITTVKVNGARLQDDFLYDSRAILALKESACGFHSKLTNPATRWYESRTLSEKYMQSGNVQRYFKEVDDVQFDVINATNFDETMLEFYVDDLSAGISTILTEEDTKRYVRYSSVPVESIVFERDDNGNAVRCWRLFKPTAYQAEARWGKKISENMKKAIAEDKGFQKFDVINYVGTRHARNVAKEDSVNMEFESLWIVKEEEHVMDESGFMDFPYANARFWVDANDDDGGYSPAMDALAAIKVVNAEKRTIIRKAQKDADPATMQPGKFWIAPLNLNPTAMNYYDATKFNKDMFSAIQTGGDLRQAVEIMALEQELIDRAFFLPLFRALSDQHKQMTVPEVQQRIAEGLGLIGPVVGRMTKTIKNVLLRTYGILDRRLLFPEPPKEIQGQELNINFLSPLAKAQRQSEIQGMMAWIEFIKGMSDPNFMPDVRDNVNGDEIATRSRDLLGVDPNVVVDKKDVKILRARRAQAQQQQAQLQMAQAGADAMKSGAEAHKTSREAAKV